MTRTRDRSTGATPGQSELVDRIDGRVILPTDERYDAARRVWNGMIDRRPAMIVECTGPGDVVEALAHARREQLPITVRGGGHGVAGRAVCDDGMVIDLASMNDVDVDPDARVAGVGPGATGADLDRATQAVGLATTSGTDSTTGVIGLTLGGGMGFLARSFGMAVDNLLGADVVLADGRQVHASETEHPDLFWALRGGGGSFGVVTGIEMRLHPVGPRVAVAQAFYPWQEATDVLRAYREFSADAPDEVGCYALAVNVPPVDPFPAEAHGTTAVAIVAGHAGPVEEGERVLRPLCEFGTPLLGGVQEMDYAVLQQTFDVANPAGKRYFWKSAYLSGMPDEAIETFISHADPLPGAYSAAYFETVGGAVGRVDPAATAFPHRTAPFNLGIGAGWDDPATDEAAIDWARRFNDAMSPFSTGGMYVNYVGDDDLGRLDATFGGNVKRLRQVKERYDPDQVFGRLAEAPSPVRRG
jgi:FAD/FMN-containing dehydrogenase